MLLWKAVNGMLPKNKSREVGGSRGPVRGRAGRWQGAGRGEGCGHDCFGQLFGHRGFGRHTDLSPQHPAIPSQGACLVRSF
jgi:hypothetical protein